MRVEVLISVACGVSKIIIKSIESTCAGLGRCSSADCGILHSCPHLPVSRRGYAASLQHGTGNIPIGQVS
jgi:hypothetical protein